MAECVQGALQAQTWLWCAPTYDQCRIAWNETLKAVGAIVTANQTQMTMTFPTKGRIIFRSLDNPNNARGHTADGVVIDEAGFVKEEAWTHVIRPIVSDTGGRVLLVGTPNGRNWFWREWTRAPLEPDMISFQIPTLGVEISNHELIRAPHPLENPDFPFAEAIQMYKTMPSRTFEQEFMAIFSQDAGGVFLGVQEASVAEPEYQPVKGNSYIMGVDWGRYHDFTVICVMDATRKRQVMLHRFQEVDYSYQTRVLKDYIAIYDPQVVLCEENAMGGPLVEALQEEDWPVWGQNVNVGTKKELIDELRLNIERSNITLLKDQIQINELQAYEMTRTVHGHLRFGAPEGMHDDCVMALALANRALEYAGPVITLI